MEPTPAMDARVRKTRRRLRDALVSLIHEKSYHAIVVNEILERADVGRSAFYAHFSNKNALLASGIDHILQRTLPRRIPSTGGPLAKVLWFSFPVLDYVGQCRHAAEAKMSRRGRAVIHQHLRQALVERIRGDVKAAIQRVEPPGISIPADLLAEHIVSTFILTLAWWIDSGSPLSPHQADDVFQSLVLPKLAAAMSRDDDNTASR